MQDLFGATRTLTDMSNRRALIALTVAGLTWGLTVPLTKVVLGWIDPAWTTVLRFGLAAPTAGARGRARRSVRRRHRGSPPGAPPASAP